MIRQGARFWFAIVLAGVVAYAASRAREPGKYRADANLVLVGATVVDGYEGMEGNGPASGTPVASRLAIASTDYIAADRVGVECMGVKPEWIGYLQFCAEAGLGQYDLSKIDVRGAKIADVRKEYRLHRDIERELKWMGPMEEVPEKLG